MEIFSIGFTQTTAQSFFGRLKQARIDRLVDVRLNNRSQLSGFAKRDDLEYFLRELVQASYEHELLLAPSEDMLADYKQRKSIPWPEYEQRFLELMRQRAIQETLQPDAFERSRSVLLCSEATPEHCHRRLVIEYLAEHWPNVQAVHL